MERLMVFVHVVAVSVFLGATVMLGVAIETLGTRAPDAFLRRQRYAAFFSAYNPLSIAALGVIVMTGAWAITPYKQNLGPAYFEQIGAALADKLVLAFFVIISATWVSFGICHRMVRADQGALPVTDAQLRRFLLRLRVAVWMTVALTLFTLWVATGIRVPHVPLPPPQ
jgi:putative copper export protein